MYNNSFPINLMDGRFQISISNDTDNQILVILFNKLCFFISSEKPDPDPEPEPDPQPDSFVLVLNPDPDS